LDPTQLFKVIDVLNQVVAAGLDRDAVCELIVERATELTNASGAVVELAVGDEMVYHRASGSARNNVGMRLSRNSSMSGLCVEMGVPLKSDDTQSDSRVNAEACRRVGAASMVCVPLFDGTRAIGVLKVVGATPFAFSDAHINTLALLANIIGTTMANAERFSDAQHDRYHDPLTGIRNRRAYDSELAREFSRAARYQKPLTLAMLDLDGFKRSTIRKDTR
jgi:GGDEF domain-containing protein